MKLEDSLDGDQLSCSLEPEHITALLQNSLVGTYIIQDSRLVCVNLRMAEMIGYSIKELTDMSSILEIIADEDKSTVTENIRRRVSGEVDVLKYETSVVRKDGQHRNFVFEGRKIAWEGSPAILGVLVDVTEYRQALRDLEHALGEKERINVQFLHSQKMEAVGRLAGGVAHDFNNHLTVIGGYSDLVLQDIGQTHPLYGDIFEIRSAAERAASLTRQLLLFSRKQVIQPKIVDVNSLITEMDKMLRRLVGEQIELEYSLSKEAGTVNIDPGHLEQVIMNLIVNSRDAMTRSCCKINIGTSKLYLDDKLAGAKVDILPGNYVVVSVTDNGSGIHRDIVGRIFEPFFTTKESGKGTGLGLSTVYGIVKQNNGDISVYSELGIGTSFKIYLPSVTGSPLLNSRTERSVQNLNGNETILLVEDDGNVKTFVSSALTRLGYNMLDASNGHQALEIAGKYNGKIDLLITDIVLPNITGMETADLIMKLKGDMKVIYMSGYSEHSSLPNSTLPSGAQYITKPFTVDGLGMKIRKILA